MNEIKRLLIQDQQQQGLECSEPVIVLLLGEEGQVDAAYGTNSDARGAILMASQFISIMCADDGEWPNEL